MCDLLYFVCMCAFQVMVFVHARNSTVRTAMTLIEMAKNRGESLFFQPEHGPDYGNCEKQVCNTLVLLYFWINEQKGWCGIVWWYGG